MNAIVPPPWTVDQFLVWADQRPREERWQLFAGVPMMMTTPSMAHQRIAMTLAMALNDGLESTGVDAFAYGPLGVRVPAVPAYLPEPDVVVASGPADERRIVDRPLLVAEVLSPSNSAVHIAAKLALCRSLPGLDTTLVIDPEAVRVSVARAVDGWRETELTRLDDVLDLPEFGTRLPLVRLYRGTKLARG